MPFRDISLVGMSVGHPREVRLIKLNIGFCFGDGKCMAFSTAKPGK
jgi:hypothetical protein